MERESRAMDPLSSLDISKYGSEKIIYVSALLTDEKYDRLRLVLKKNKDVFAWKHSDMPNISPIVASHKLNVSPTARPVR